ncbi:MAG: hypothetical protein DRO99_00675 [Candidatus Aenigmatarchaeota archaeon]|nr:MAG: hypothetical protein DRO99_00675 [Candidatus Aenigmarchaeota archaeon]
MPLPEEPKKDIIKQLITHMNTVEDKINLVKDSIAETEDLIMVNKLDIINLKNQIEKLKLSTPEVSPETLNKLRSIEEVADKLQIDKWKNMEKDIEGIKSYLKKTGGRDMDDVTASLQLMDQRLKKLESGSVTKSDHKVVIKKHDNHEKAISDLHKRVKEVEKKTEHLKKCPSCGNLVKMDAKFCNRCGKKV